MAATGEGRPRCPAATGKVSVMPPESSEHRGLILCAPRGRQLSRREKAAPGFYVRFPEQLRDALGLSLRHSGKRGLRELKGRGQNEGSGVSTQGVPQSPMEEREATAEEGNHFG